MHPYLVAITDCPIKYMQRIRCNAILIAFFFILDLNVRTLLQTSTDGAIALVVQPPSVDM